MKNPQIEVRELKKSFNETVVLDQINFTVHRGESLVVIGASGSGKSVLAKCIVGLLKPDNGNIFLDGRRLDTNSSDSTPVAASSISYVFQNSALFDSLTVIENISFGPQFLNQQNEDDANKIARESMIKLDIHPKFWPMYPKELSSSSRKIVAIARALAVKPKIIIFDEPSTGLDIRASHKLDYLIRDSVKNDNITAITITHDIDSALHIADTIAMLHEGKLIWSGEASELKKSNQAEVRRFIKPFLTST